MLKGAIALAVITACQGCAVTPYTVDIGSMLNPPEHTIKPKGGIENSKSIIRGRWGEFKGTIE
jgi:hypothetical protein